MLTSRIMMTKESEKSLKVTRNVETSSGGVGSGSVVRHRSGTGQTTPNNKKQRSGMAPSSEATTTTTTHSSQNGHQEDQVNGMRPKPNCCLCWCCCCSCNGMKRGNNEENKPKPKDPDSDLNCDAADSPPSLEEIRSWGESFEKLMRCNGGRKVFREFLKCEYSEENILFWLACEDLKKESKPELIEEKARLIYEDYISILSPKEVSLDARVREVVNQNMVDPTPHTFDEAQVQIFTLMHRDSYPRFVNSQLYRKLAQLNNNTPHRGSSVSAVSNPASRKESLAS